MGSDKLALYQKTVKEFKKDIEMTENGQPRGEYVARELAEAYATVFHKDVKESEQNSWRNSLPYVKDALEAGGIPDDCYVLLEYKIPEREERIDCALAGLDRNNRDRLVIIELKQWSAKNVKASELYRFVYVKFAKEDKLCIHPALQAGQYKDYLENMVSAFHDNSVSATACAYLHNYQSRPDDPLLGTDYREFIKKAQVFLAPDAGKLSAYLHDNLQGGNGAHVLEKLAASKVQPSKKLIETIDNELNGIEEFSLLGKQYTVYNYIVSKAQKDLRENRKTVILVQGGPGTGKSVIAVKALASLLKVTRKVRFVASNATFRKCSVYKLEERQSMASNIKDLFQWSGNAEKWADNKYDILLCDECQKLNRRHLESVIRTAKVCVFLGDDSQTIDLLDYGTVSHIKEACARNIKEKNRPIDIPEVLRLTAQFRCAGMDEYVKWVEETLKMPREGGQGVLNLDNFDFKVLETPGAVYEQVKALNGKVQGARKLTARMVAGFAWPWSPYRQRGKLVADVRVCDETGNVIFERPWNDFDKEKRPLWAVLPNAIEEIGCAHTVLGLEFDYVGVIIGKDLIYDKASDTVRAVLENYYANGKEKYARLNRSILQERLDRNVKNIYRILLTRGMKGCYVYCCDKGLQEYLKQRVQEARVAKG